MKAKDLEELLHSLIFRFKKPLMKKRRKMMKRIKKEISRGPL
jgi:hypothetical protein